MVDESTPKDTDAVNDSGTPSETPDQVGIPETESAQQSEVTDASEGPSQPVPDSEDSASVDTQLEELREAVLRAKADAQNIQRRA